MSLITTNKYMPFLPMKLVWDVIFISLLQPLFHFESTALLLFQCFVKNICMFVIKPGKPWLLVIKKMLLHFSVQCFCLKQT